MAWLWVAAGRIISPNASAYCQARKRLPSSWLDAIRRQVAERIEGEVTEFLDYVQREFFQGKEEEFEARKRALVSVRPGGVVRVKARDE